MSSVRHARFDDFEAFAASVPGASLAATPLRPGPFFSATTELRLGDVVLQVGRNTPLMALGAVDPGTLWVVLPLGAAGTLRLDGREVGPGDVALHGPGAHVNGANSQDTGWALVALPSAAAEALLEPPRRSPLPRPGTHAVLRVDGDAWERAASLVRGAAAVAAEDPGVFAVAEARRGLRDELLEALRELLACRHGGTRTRPLPAPSERRRTLRAVEDLLRAEPGRAGSVEEVCATLRLPPSRLRAAVKASFAVDAELYLRLRRLALVRAALRPAGGEPRWAEVAQVAAAHGFRDMEAFTQEYHDLFGEDPALTFRLSAE
ncbi:helix-turn-helix domain-containing protein [Siccirubricoccus sp. G192]|uniref:helix-turn-helix domain-containing protein n=1 Tax=Siccirubricoccus sp. G192 TaxID=2849651 RepID=UPI001C2C125E|nr:helix-turn-helix domain-containing protein [Siccirubricoccus sp. G192]MBV1798926.1 helix-turn-helix domain-containing protein [Siccirubricoccus sp. G192]